MNRGFARALIFAAALLMAGCANFGDRSVLMPKANLRDASDLAAAKTFMQAGVAPAGWPPRDWWRRFEDPGLDTAIADALRDNPSLDAASARLRQAEAAAASAGAMLRPQASASATSAYQRLSENYIIPPPYGGTWQWQSQAMLNGSYRIDLWGGHRAAAESAIGRARAAAVDSLGAELTLTTALTRAYIQLSRAYDQRDLAKAALEARQRVLDLVNERVAAGLDSQLQLKQAEAAVPTAREQIAAWDEAVTVARNQLAALAGQGPDAGATIPRPHLKEMPAGALLPTVLPAELIGRRPDVIAQRLRVEASLREVDAAEAAFYPNIDLTAFAGLQSLGLARFVESGSIVAGVGPAITLPLFDGDTLRARLAGKSADADAAVAGYRQTLVSALQEIADELAASRSIATQIAEQRSAVIALKEAYDLAVFRYKEGVGNYLEVLTAETQLLAQRSLAADLRSRELDIAVRLIESLGGGFDTPMRTVRVSSREAQP